MQSDAELDGAAQFCRTCAHVSDLLRNLCRGLTPGQVRIHLLGSQVVGRSRRTTEVHGGMGLLHWWVKQLGAFDTQVFALKIVGLTAVAAGQNLAPDANELGGLFVTRSVVQEHAVTFQLGLVTTGHQVHQQAAARQAVKRGGHTCGQCGLVQAGAHGHQKFQALGGTNQARRDDPRVFTRPPGGDQHAFIPQPVCRTGHLLQVTQVHLARTFTGAQVTAIAMGGEKPKNLHRQTPSNRKKQTTYRRLGGQCTVHTPGCTCRPCGAEPFARGAWRGLDGEHRHTPGVYGDGKHPRNLLAQGAGDVVWLGHGVSFRPNLPPRLPAR